jgi:DNA-binding XRE family transcriptional regulator
MHPLTLYRLRTRTTKVELARQLGITRAWTWEIECNGQKPGRALALAIERLTHGAIRVEDWDNPDFRSRDESVRPPSPRPPKAPSSSLGSENPDAPEPASGAASDRPSARETDALSGRLSRRPRKSRTSDPGRSGSASRIETDEVSNGSK